MSKDEQLKKIQDLKKKDFNPDIKKAIADKEKHFLTNKPLKK